MCALLLFREHPNFAVLRLSRAPPRARDRRVETIESAAAASARQKGLYEWTVHVVPRTVIQQTTTTVRTSVKKKLVFSVTPPPLISLFLRRVVVSRTASQTRHGRSYRLCTVTAGSCDFRERREFKPRLFRDDEKENCTDWDTCRSPYLDREKVEKTNAERKNAKTKNCKEHRISEYRCESGDVITLS